MKKSECDFIFARPRGKKHLIILSFEQDDYIFLLLELQNAINLMWDHEYTNDTEKENGNYILRITGLKKIGLGEDIILKETLKNESYYEDWQNVYSSLTQQAMSDIVNRIQQVKGDISGPEKNRKNVRNTSDRKRTDGISSSSNPEKGSAFGTGEESK